MTNKERLAAVEALIRDYNPKFKVVYKDESRLMKVLARVLFFNKTFMTDYTTVVGSTVYVPRESYDRHPRVYAGVMAHELIHFIQKKEHRAFGLMYLFPQILCVLSALSLVAIFASNWWLLNLLWLLMLMPWPAPWRARFEMEAYEMTAFATRLHRGRLSYSMLSWIVEGPLTGMDYYKMIWRKRKADQWAEDTIAVMNFNPPESYPYPEIEEILGK